MAKKAPVYAIGDMVVHRFYGIGQIDAVENKPLNNGEVECFKVITDNGIYWFPTDSEDNPRVHPVASKKDIKKAVAILKSAPQDLEIDPIQWKERIDETQTEGGFLAISKLVRDLSALKKQKKLNRTQDQALNNLKNRLLREWAAGLEVDVDTIRPQLRAYLQESGTKSENAG